MPASVLIGNGFNRTNTNQPSWEEILKAIAKEIGDPTIVSLYGYKPETLIFEQLCFADKISNKEDKIKSKLAGTILKQKPSNLHIQALGLGFRHILTTNYDYSFEEAGSKEQPEERKSGSRETKYSLFRHHNTDGTLIWHIHGEANSSKTIMLGYEHYAGSLQNLRTYMTGDRTSSKKRRFSQFKTGNNTFDVNGDEYSWLDVFFRDDIHIIGLSLDFTESDLWWAITYKQKLRYYKKVKPGKTIYHYMPPPSDDDPRPLDAKLEVFRSLGVETKAFDRRRGYASSYMSALEQAANQKS